MPKITVRYNSGRLNILALRDIYTVLALKVAQAAEESFTLEEIDYYTYPNGPFSKAPVLAIEIQTMGKPERKKRMNAAVLSWREALNEIPEVKGLKLPPGTPLIWIQYVDPEGPHV